MRSSDAGAIDKHAYRSMDKHAYRWSLMTMLVDIRRSYAFHADAAYLAWTSKLELLTPAAEDRAKCRFYKREIDPEFEIEWITKPASAQQPFTQRGPTPPQQSAPPPPPQRQQQPQPSPAASGAWRGARAYAPPSSAGAADAASELRFFSMHCAVGL